MNNARAYPSVARDHSKMRDLISELLREHIDPGLDDCGLARFVADRTYRLKSITNALRQLTTQPAKRLALAYFINLHEKVFSRNEALWQLAAEILESARVTYELALKGKRKDLGRLLSDRTLGRSRYLLAWWIDQKIGRGHIWPRIANDARELLVQW